MPFCLTPIFNSPPSMQEAIHGTISACLHGQQLLSSGVTDE
jgi:hypothetical protein